MITIEEISRINTMLYNLHRENIAIMEILLTHFNIDEKKIEEYTELQDKCFCNAILS